MTALARALLLERFGLTDTERERRQQAITTRTSTTTALRPSDDPYAIFALLPADPAGPARLAELNAARDELGDDDTEQGDPA